MAGTGVLRPECAWSGLAIAPAAAADTRTKIAALWQLSAEHVDSGAYGG